MKFLVIIAMTITSFATLASHNYIVKLKSGLKSNHKINKTLKSLGNTQSLNTSFGSFQLVTADKALNLKSLNKSLNSQIEYIEKDVTYHAIRVANPMTDLVDDPRAKKQWALFNDGKNSGGFFFGGKAGEDINVVKAWDITKGSRDIIVGVIDTGVDYSHEDLKNNSWTNEAELNGVEGIDDDNNGYIDDIHGYDFVNNDGDPMDDHSHGTHCAGVIGAEHNDKGIAGINANVRIMGLKFLSANGGGEGSDAIRAIDYAIKMGVHVLSNSWGGGEQSQALIDAISAANDAGIIFVAASGNSSSDNDSRPTYPCSYDVENIISVGSFSGTGKKSGFSNYGAEKVHVFAPGGNIISTVPNNKYKKMSGTSMACPQVAGMMALLVSQEMMTPVQAKERAINTSVKTEKLQKYSQSQGRMDTYRLLENIQN